MTREKFPEKIPFRLTRMLVNAMEVTGIEGNFRVTCNVVMRVLRQNKDSLMAVLEAFVYDPLLNWRLVDGEGDCVCVCVCVNAAYWFSFKLTLKTQPVLQIVSLNQTLLRCVCCLPVQTLPSPRRASCTRQVTLRWSPLTVLTMRGRGMAPNPRS